MLTEDQIWWVYSSCQFP